MKCLQSCKLTFSKGAGSRSFIGTSLEKTSCFKTYSNTWQLPGRYSYSSDKRVVPAYQFNNVHSMRLFSTSNSPRKFPAKDLYAVLDVSPFATQSQIKESYYKLSMKYHPDQNKGDIKTEDLFKELNDAYSVIGKQSSRRNYDKGLLRDYPVPHHVKEMKHRRATYSSIKTTTSRVYNFEEFNKGHYGDILKRSREFQRRKKTDHEHAVGRTTHESNHLYVVPATLMIILWYLGFKNNI